jgi:hypothetical protein
LSKFVTSKPKSLTAGSISWLLAQTFWVGGLWLLQFVLLPAMSHSGLASMLVSDMSAVLAPLLVGLAACCACLQLLVLVSAEGLRSMWQDMRGQLLLAVLGLAASYLLADQLWSDPRRWQLFSYLVMALCGLLLVLQPVPVSAKRKPI